MLKKALTAFVVAAGITTIAGTDLKLNGEFKNVKNNVPVGWTQNKGGWAKPFGKVEIVKEDGKNLLKITSDKKATHVYTSKTFPAKAGDKVELEIKAKGKGKAAIGIYIYAKGGWAGSAYKFFTLTDKLTEKKFVVTVTDRKKKDGTIQRKATNIRVVVVANPKTELVVEEVDAEVKDEKK
jgi:hypothetical protein